jgi:hypothetical protein
MSRLAAEELFPPPDVAQLKKTLLNIEVPNNKTMKIEYLAIFTKAPYYGDSVSQRVRFV